MHLSKKLIVIGAIGALGITVSNKLRRRSRLRARLAEARNPDMMPLGSYAHLPQTFDLAKLDPGKALVFYDNYGDWWDIERLDGSKVRPSGNVTRLKVNTSSTRLAELTGVNLNECAYTVEGAMFRRVEEGQALRLFDKNGPVEIERTVKLGTMYISLAPSAAFA